MSRDLSRESMKMDMRNERRTLDNAPNIAEDDNEVGSLKEKPTSNVFPSAVSKEDLDDLIGEGDSPEGAKEQGGEKEVVVEGTRGLVGPVKGGQSVTAKTDVAAGVCVCARACIRTYMHKCVHVCVCFVCNSSYCMRRAVQGDCTQTPVVF